MLCFKSVSKTLLLLSKRPFSPQGDSVLMFSLARESLLMCQHPQTVVRNCSPRAKRCCRAPRCRPRWRASWRSLSRLTVRWRAVCLFLSTRADRGICRRCGGAVLRALRRARARARRRRLRRASLPRRPCACNLHIRLARIIRLAAGAKRLARPVDGAEHQEQRLPFSLSLSLPLSH